MSDNHNDEYEKICFICRRPESRAGKMLDLPGGFSVCPGCLQKALDSIESSGLSYEELMRMTGMNLPPGLDLSALLKNQGASGSAQKRTPEQTKNPPGSEGSGKEKTEKKPAVREKEGSSLSGHEKEEPSASGPEKGKQEGSGRSGGNRTSGSGAYHGEVISVGGDEPSGDTPENQQDTDAHPRMTNISMINLGDLFGMIPQRQRVKKKRPPQEEKKEPFDLKKIPAPHKIKAGLDEYVIGQDYAKKVISVAVYNHYKRVACMDDPDVEIEKSNMLMIGPTGSGKTYLVKTLARLLDVPLAITDATTLTEAGYIGDDIESVVSRLLAAADNDVERAQQGIIFIDEIDKIAKKENTNHRDVSGESVQQGLLKLLEGSEVEVPVGATSKNAMVPLETVNTKNILFICGGAFPGLETIIKERLSRQAGIGFGSDLKDKFEDDPDILQKVTVEDIRRYGMIPEFIGRLPIVFSLRGLDRDMLVQILQKPRNAIIRQYEKLLAMDEVKLEFEKEALEAIADKALEKKTGARGLRSVIEKIMLDIMYEIPKDQNIGAVRITRAYIENRGGPVISLRTAGELPGE